jgi:hypothetical protein
VCVCLLLSRRDGFFFNGDFFPGVSGVLPNPSSFSWLSRTDSELLFHRNKLNFAGAQRDYFIIMITEVPVQMESHLLMSTLSNHDLPCTIIRIQFQDPFQIFISNKIFCLNSCHHKSVDRSGAPQGGHKADQTVREGLNVVWVKEPSAPNHYIKNERQLCQSSSCRFLPISGTATLRVLSRYRAKPISKTVTPPK